LVDRAAGEGTKNDQFRDMLRAAAARGLKPRCVCLDCRYSGKGNLKAVRALGWTFLTQVRCNRRVNPDRTGNRAIEECDIAAAGTVVHLEGFGPVRAFRIAAAGGRTEHWITNDLSMGAAARLGLAERAWGIEEFHRGLTQHTAVDRCQTQMACAQRNHVGFALRAFVRLDGIGSPPGSVGSPPRWPSSAGPSADSWHGRPTNCQQQLRKSYSLPV
jgi:hypothetical protein